MFGSKEERAARFPPIDPKNLPPRLVSFGRQTAMMPGSNRGSQKPKIFEYEGYVDIRNPRNTFMREPGSTVLQAQMERTGGEDQVLDSFSVPGKNRNPPSGNHPAGEPNRIIPQPEVSDEERRLARALFARVEGPADPKPVPAFDDCPW